MASGKPVVASDIPGYRAVSTTASTGCSCRPATPTRSRARSPRCCATPRGASRLGRRGRAKAETYGWGRVTERLEAYYLEVLSGRPRAS